jgi:hypothetical protein
MSSDLFNLGLDIRNTLTSNVGLELPGPNIALAIEDGFEPNAIARFLRNVWLYGRMLRPFGNRENMEWLHPTVRDDIKNFNPHTKPTDVHEARFMAMFWEGKVSRKLVDNVLVDKAVETDLESGVRSIKVILKSVEAFQHVPKEHKIVVHALSIAHT